MADQPSQTARPPEVLCRACGGGNTPVARHCQWCGVALQSAQAPVFTPPTASTTPQALLRPRPNACAPLLVVGLIVGTVLVIAAGVSGFRFGAAPGTGSITGSTVPTPHIVREISKPATVPSASEPSYIKQVTGYKEGSHAHVFYFILADSGGAMVAADGTVKVEIIKNPSKDPERDLVLYSRTMPVKSSDFKKTTVGQGAFEHEVLLYMIGRVAASDYDLDEVVVALYNGPGKVKVSFTTASGKVLTGEERILFDDY